MLDLRRLRLLHDLSRLGTIAAVAEAHTYTASAVSQQLSALEREAGVALLERTGRRVTLTAAGRLLVRHAETVLAAVERATAALATVRGGLSGPLRIGAFPTAVRTLLSPALVALGRDHPRLELMVTEVDPVGVPERLQDRRLDVGLTQDYDVAPGIGDPAIESTPLVTETVFLAVPASSEIQTVDDTRDEPWIVASPGTLCYVVAQHVCRAGGFAPRVRHQADDFVTVLSLVGAGQGVSLVPQLAATTTPPGVRLLELPIRRRTQIAYRRGGGEHPAVAAFVAAMSASAADVMGNR
jgi:DNA-binding transcriptional LysR family regulator